jgi:hypothetical protein
MLLNLGRVFICQDGHSLTEVRNVVSERGSSAPMVLDLRLAGDQ